MLPLVRIKRQPKRIIIIHLHYRALEMLDPEIIKEHLNGSCVLVAQINIQISRLSSRDVARLLVVVAVLAVLARIRGHAVKTVTDYRNLLLLEQNPVQLCLGRRPCLVGMVGRSKRLGATIKAPRRTTV